MPDIRMTDRGLKVDRSLGSTLVKKRDLLNLIDKDLDRDFNDPGLQGSDVDKSFRKNIGARNPYAIAERNGLLHVISRKSRVTRPDIGSLLNSPYQELFDPYHNSPVYGGMEGVKERSKKLNPGAGAFKPCDNPPNDWKPLQLSWRSGGAYKYDDSVQGCLANCYFLAALSSVVWTLPNFLSGTDGVAGFYYKKDDQTTSRKVIGNTQTGTTKDINVYVPSGGTKEVKYAFSSRGDVEWVSFYEKAYSVFRWWYDNGKPSPINTPERDRPPMNNLNFGDPLQGLYNLTGRKYYSAPEDLRTYWTQPSMIQRGSLSAYDRLLSKNIEASASDSKRTRNPTVAWTFPTGYENNTQYIEYLDEYIPANHAFSVLGIHVVNSTKYIILRNSFGPAWFGDPKTTTNLLLQGNYAVSDRTAINLADNDGIFGITDDAFSNYFQGFGWVVP